MNELHGLWLHYVPASGFTDYDAFHCYVCDEESEACQFCHHCCISERYEIQLRVRQGYKGGFELWKDWEDWEDADPFDRGYACNIPVYLGGTRYIDKDFNLWEGVFKNEL